MKSYTTDEFWELYRALPEKIRRQAQEVDKKRHLWSARITRGYRVLGIRDDGEITWFWIGTHREYDKLIRGR